MGVTTANCVVDLIDMNIKTATYYFHRLLEIITQESKNKNFISGELRVNESYFRYLQKDKRGHVVANKAPIGEPLKKYERVYIGDD